jgi:hopanoid biosynthesis associated radical SAM protein HpnH
VSIACGEPTIHPRIDQIINTLVAEKYFVYCCTNGLLLDRVMDKVPPSKYLCWVVHLDGMEAKHDESVDRAGVFKKAVDAIQSALDRGYRVCTNSTVFRTSDVEDLTEMFRLVSDMGTEGSMISPGFDFEDAPDQEMFLTRQESHALFQELLSPENTKGANFYNNPLYLDFLRGERDYECTAYSNPTYTVLGWRVPCYALADTHTRTLSDLFTDQVWERYGVGKNPKCANCMMHSGFESATLFSAMGNPRELTAMVRGVLGRRGGLGAR